ncbi:12018_t:CDS:2, partial [Ambispora gerdemannii]
ETNLTIRDLEKVGEDIFQNDWMRKCGKKYAQKCLILAIIVGRAKHFYPLIPGDTFVYQGLTGGIEINTIREVVQKTIDLPFPDITFVLDIDPKKAQERLKKRKLETDEYTNWDNLNLDFHQKIRNNYLELKKYFPERICLVDASQSEEKILAEVQEIIQQTISPKKDLPSFVRVVIKNDKGETPETAAKREVYEETNLVLENCQKIAEKSEIKIKELGKILDINAYGSVEILSRIDELVSNKDKSVNIGYIRMEVYSSHLRQKLAAKYLSASFPQTQKARFILTNYENEAINVGTKAAQIFNRCFYALVTLFILTVAGLLLYQLAYRPRWRRTRNIQRENKHFEELKENTEYIKITGTEKQEIKKNKSLLHKNLKKILPLAVNKSLFATVPNYLMVKALPLPFLLAANSRGMEEIYLFLLYTKLNALFEKDNSTAVFVIKPLPAKKASITFQKVNFAYPASQKKILDNFSFSFQKGQKYAIIGANGIGKSTLFKLMIKLYQPQSGEIKLNSNKQENIANSAWQKKIVYLPNHPYFFNTSLGNNIVYPDTYQANTHQEKLENTAQKLGITEFIDKLPHR